MKKSKEQWEKIRIYERNKILSYIKNKELNSYYQKNPIEFNELIELLLKYPASFSRCLQAKSKQKIRNWIISSTSLLFSNQYQISERIYWIINDIITWNDERCKCHQCKCHLSIENNNHHFHGLYGGYSNYCSLKCIGKSEEVKQHRKDGNIRKFGYENAFQSPIIIKQCKQTKLEKYGDLNWNNREKAFKTCIKRLGVKIPSQNRDVMLKSNLKYIYNNIIFASSWELAFYIWLKDNKINFQYQPDFNFYYFDEYQNKIRKYFPDFYLIDFNQIIEIKGDNHFDKNGYPIYRNRPWKNKYDFMLQHNIKILRKNEIQKYLDYCNNKFSSKTWYKQFKKQ